MRSHVSLQSQLTFCLVFWSDDGRGLCRVLYRCDLAASRCLVIWICVSGPGPSHGHDPLSDSCRPLTFLGDLSLHPCGLATLNGPFCALHGHDPLTFFCPSSASHRFLILYLYGDVPLICFGYDACGKMEMLLKSGFDWGFTRRLRLESKWRCAFCEIARTLEMEFKAVKSVPTENVDIALEFPTKKQN
jgi:hypothetical protein